MWYDRIKVFYDKGLWTADMVQMAVTIGLITQAEADEIVGENNAEV